MGRVNPRLAKVVDMVKTETVIPIIVELYAAPTRTVISELEAAGLTVTEVSEVAPYVYGRIQAGQVDTLAKLPPVKEVFYDEPVYPALLSPLERLEREEVIIPISKTVEALGAKKLHNQGITGKEVKVAVLDTGGDPTHPFYSENIIDVFSTVPGEAVAPENHSHGSWCCGAVAGTPVEATYKGEKYDLVGMAPEASLILGKCLSDEGSGQTSWIIQAMEEAYKRGADVVSMSLGSLVGTGNLSPLDRPLNLIARKGVLFVVAAGNSALPFTVGSPGDATEAITVAAVAFSIPYRNSVSTFSSKGPSTSLKYKPDIGAYGGNISAMKVEVLLSSASRGEYEAMAGTSMATPQIAGGLALLVQGGLEKRKVSAEAALSMGARGILPRWKNLRVGWGVPDLAVSYAMLDRTRLPSLPSLRESIGGMFEFRALRFLEMMIPERFLTPRLAIMD